MSDDPVIPAPLDDDDDDVAWALQTAAVQWQRGAQADAVVWIRRAVDSAIASGNSRRTNDLTRLAAEVADRIVARVSVIPEASESEPPDALGVDDLLDGGGPPLPQRPPPRRKAQTLTNEIPVEFDTDLLDDADTLDGGEEPGGALAGGEEDDDEADDQPTLPPGPPDGVWASEVPEGGRSADESQALSVEPGELFSRAPPGVPPDFPLDEPAAPLPGDDGEAVPGFHRESPRELLPFELPPPQAPLEDEAAGPASEEPPPLPEPDLDEETPPDGPSSAPASLGGGPAVVAGIALGEVRGFEDLPEEAQAELCRLATITTLSEDEEVGAFGAALVASGEVGLMSSIADVAASVAFGGEIIFTRGTLADGVPLRVVALQDDTIVATWSAADLDRIMADCPWVADELRLVADRFQALAGATLGPLGDRLDATLLKQVLTRLEVKAFGGGEVIVQAGKAVPGLHVVGAGRVELTGESGKDEFGPGDILFAAEVLGAGVSTAEARAGKGGALVLIASRAVAHQLLLEVPPLIEILAS